MKEFQCKVKDCKKSYGEERSRKRHHELKHPKIKYESDDGGQEEVTRELSQRSNVKRRRESW